MIAFSYLINDEISDFMSLGLDRGLDIGSLQYIDGVAYFTDIRSYHTQHENIIGAPKCVIIMELSIGPNWSL